MTTRIQATIPPVQSGAARYVAALALWFVAAFAAAAAGVVSAERRFVVPIAIFGTLAILVVLYRRSAPFRAFARAIDVRWILAFQSLRAPIGAAFLVLMGRGLLAPEFALVAGWGDIVAGGLAFVLVFLAPFERRARRPLAAGDANRVKRRLLLGWNAIGLVDIAVVVLTAQRIFLFGGEPEKLRGIIEFPGPLLPLFVVPLVFATHLLVFATHGGGTKAECTT